MGQNKRVDVSRSTGAREADKDGQVRRVWATGKGWLPEVGTSTSGCQSSIGNSNSGEKRSLRKRT